MLEAVKRPERVIRIGLCVLLVLAALIVLLGLWEAFRR
jgi:hypothetical protein